MDDAVSKLTINKDSKVDHKKELLEVAKLLNIVRKKDASENVNFEQIHNEVTECKDFESLLKVLQKNEDVRSSFSRLEQMSLFESLLGIGHSHVNGPLKIFPPDINRNLYADIIRFSLENCQGVVSLLLNLIVDREKPVTEFNVIEIAYMFSYLAHSVNRKNDAVTKVKTILLKQEGLNNDGLDICSALGVTETGRTYRKLRDFLAGISTNLMFAAASLTPHQSTLDNLDISVNGTNYHMVMSFLEFESEPTDHLDTKSLGFDEMKKLFDIETILVTSSKYKELFDHYKMVTAITVGRFLGSSVKEAKVLKKLLPNHYNHPTSKAEPEPANLFTKQD